VRVLVLTVPLLLAACGASSDDDADVTGETDTMNGGGGGGGGGGQSDDPWGDGRTRPAAGHISHVELMRSGCGEELWARFVPTADFGLLSFTATDADGTAYRLTNFEVPVFEDGEPSYYLALDEGNYPDEAYEVDFEVRDGDGATLTHSFDLTPEGLPLVS
jgi:hypothetical protein